MQPIQDKDLDKLFKQRFDALEVQPSAGSWKKITDTLDKPLKRSRSYSVWMAAASLVILASAALVLYKPAEVIKLQGPADTQLAAKVDSQSATELQEREVINKEAKEISVRDIQPASSKLNRTFAKAARKDLQQSPNSQEDERTNPDLISTSEVSVAVTKEKSPVKRAEIKPESKTYEPVYTAQAVEKDDPEFEVEISRPRIKSVGGLVNFVIAQVDKREDKIIEFKDGEEGSELSGINIGLLKLKSRKR